MNITDIFIKKPVLATVVSLLILVLGIRAFASLPVRQYPKTENAQVTVSTAYFGADPDVVAGFITTPLEAVIAQAQGIDFMTSSSSSGISTITATMKLNYDSNKALTEISSKVNSVRNQLPAAAQAPVITVLVGEAVANLYLGFDSKVLTPNKVTDYLIRVVQPKLQTVAGVKQAEIIGARQFALRAWLQPEKLAAVGLTAGDIALALQKNNYLAAVGATKGSMISVNLTSSTDLHSLDDFRLLVVKQKGDQLVRLQDVANVTLGAENYDSNVALDGKPSVFLAIRVAPDANLLTVIRDVRTAFVDVQAALPVGMTGQVVYDSTKFVNSSIREVKKTLIEALAIVSLVIFLFLGNLRSVIIPIIAMPLSLIGAFFVMLLLGYSVNLLTLLALVLAIGLVVDDAIIVVENVDRHIKLGKTPLEAALTGARELASPIIAISVVLIAVYVPIGFQDGLVGVLFSEFAFTLAGAVAVSAVIALTLSPMMAATFLRPHRPNGKKTLADQIDHNFERFGAWYQRLLSRLLDTFPVIVVFGLVILLLIGVLFKMSQSELAPQEDQGIVLALTTGAPTATIDQMKLYSTQVAGIAKTFPEYDHLFQIDGLPNPNGAIAGLLLKPWDERKRTATPIQNEYQGKLSHIAGANIFAFQRPALPGAGGGLPVQFVISTTEPFRNIFDVSQAILDKAKASGKFFVLDSNLKLDKPQTRIVFDKDKINAMGLSMQDVGATLGAALGGGYTNYFSIAGRSYRVIPQMEQKSRLNAEQLANYYIRTPAGGVVPGSTIASLKTEVVPQSINHFQQLNSATISGVFNGTQGEALALLNQIGKEVLPAGYRVDYGGESRQFVAESGSFITTLLFALLIIYLVLAAQFESFVDPLIVIMSVPMAIFGAMVFIFEDLATLNIYTQVGLVTLVGLIAKHGILIVEFANQLQEQGKSKREAIEMATAIRLRPILMTTASMVMGVVPLVIASGAGAVGRNHMGLVIFTGISIGTLFTLFVVPAMYLFLARDHRKLAPVPAVPGDAALEAVRS